MRIRLLTAGLAAFLTAVQTAPAQSDSTGAPAVAGTHLPVTPSDPAGYTLLRSFPIGGTGGWDYIAVKPDLHRLYVAHDSLVNILNEETGESLGVISHTPGVHGIAFADSFGKGYTSNGRAGTLTVFDLQTNAVRREIRAGENPDAIMYDPFSKKIFVCNGRSRDASVVDPATDSLIAAIPLDGKPETAVSDGAGRVYVNIEDKNELAVVNAASWKVMSRWKIGKGESPTGLAIDARHKRLFAGCGNKLMVVLNAETGAVVSELPIGDRCDGTAFDPGTGYAFASCGDGTLTVVREETPDIFRVVANVPTKRGARTLALDEQTHHLFLPTAKFEAPRPATAGAEAPAARQRPRVIPGTFEVLEVGSK